MASETTDRLDHLKSFLEEGGMDHQVAQGINEDTPNSTLVELLETAGFTATEEFRMAFKERFGIDIPDHMLYGEPEGTVGDMIGIAQGQGAIV